MPARVSAAGEAKTSRQLNIRPRKDPRGHAGQLGYWATSLDAAVAMIIFPCGLGKPGAVGNVLLAMPLIARSATLLRGVRERVAGRALRRPAKQTVSLVRRRARPVSFVIARLTITAILAYEVARLATGAENPILAPLTALLVVQVTLYRTFRSALQRVASVVAGVLVALGLSSAFGFT